MFGPMVEFTMDYGSTIKWKAPVDSLGAMDGAMWANIKMTRNMDRVHLSGLTVGNI